MWYHRPADDCGEAAGKQCSLSQHTLVKRPGARAPAICHTLCSARHVRLTRQGEVLVWRRNGDTGYTCCRHFLAPYINTSISHFHTSQPRYRLVRHPTAVLVK